MKRSLSILALLAFSAPAYAADFGHIGVKDSPVPVANYGNFGGLTVDIFAGASVPIGDVLYNYTDTWNYDEYRGSYSEHSSFPAGAQGPVIGTGLQYLFQNDRFLIGPYVSANASFASAEAKWGWKETCSYCTPESASDGGHLKVEQDWGISGGLKIGFEVAPKTAVFTYGGIAQTHLEISGTDVTAENGFDTSPTLTGWEAGIEARHAMGNGWGLFAGYTFQDFDSKTVWSNPEAGAYEGGSWSEKADIDLNNHIFKIGFSKTIN